MKLKESLTNKTRIFISKIIPYKYDAKKYEDTFLRYSYPLKKENQKSKIDECIYCFWTGDNKMSENRKNGINSLIEKSGVPVKLITPDNLQQYILPEAPLHPQFNNLSLVHKSDYLRCYFMHHYGGGYSDIKTTTSSWVDFFKKLKINEDKYIIGYPEKKYIHVAQLKGDLGKDLKKNFPILLGNGAYICRAYTPFTGDWYQELLKRMDLYAKDLEKHPGNIWGDNDGYPIPWTNILGDIFHPLCLKHHKHLLYNKKIRPITYDYR